MSRSRKKRKTNSSPVGFSGGSVVANGPNTGTEDDAESPAVRSASPHEAATNSPHLVQDRLSAPPESTSEATASVTGPVSPTLYAPAPPDQELSSDGSFVVFKPTVDDASFRKLNVFWPAKQLYSICALENAHIEAPFNGTLIIKTQSRTQTKQLLKITEFCGKTVTVFLHPSRNSSQGTIWAPDLRHMSESELLTDLQDQAVTGVRRLTTKKDGQRRDTHRLVLTFASLTLPQNIKIGYLNFEVAIFVPNPIRCFKCQRYGHGINSCSFHSARCPLCGEPPHGEEPCPVPQRCLSCNSKDHATTSNHCPVWLREKEICALKTRTGVSWQQARRQMAASPIAETKTYSQVITVFGQVSNITPTSTVCTQTNDLPQLPPLELLLPRPSTACTTRTIDTQTPVLMPISIFSSSPSTRSSRSPWRPSKSTTRFPAEEHTTDFSFPTSQPTTSTPALTKRQEPNPRRDTSKTRRTKI